MSRFGQGAATRSNVNEDLLWNIGAFNRTEEAVNFFRGMRQWLPVYSASTEKLYGEYSVALTKGENPRLVTLPDMNHFDAVYSFIGNDAVSKTNCFIFPGLKADGPKYYLGARVANGKIKVVTFKAALSQIMTNIRSSDRHLPVIQNSSLRRLPQQKHPMLWLHSLDVGKLTNLSQFARDDLLRSARQRLWTALKEFPL